MYCQIFVKSEGMFLLSSENLSPNETDSGDVEIIWSTWVLRGEGLSGGLSKPASATLCHKLRPSGVYKVLVVFFPASPLPEIPVQLKTAALEELWMGYSTVGWGMLAGCLGWLVGRGPEAGVAGKGASPIQMLQERKLHRVDPSAHYFCSKPVLCIVPSHALFAPVSSCSRLSRNGMCGGTLCGAAGAGC